ncbi:eCIS core domain-containing protein [Flavobacterium soyae]|uniref:eCIS core domain-containing protein n=1 Tax=Flavobacterium soyae TaxID=2903098 RepID=UPI001E4D79FF|nr:DUF4157 domain-containing protein [Flavobacterium soyae]MCD9576665.1 DUF4157 domain-containing protein [Flavobacterium soyae]
MREFEQKKIANHSPSTFFGPKVQKKLTTGTVGDKYEIEADNVADKVVNKRKTGGLLQSRSEEAVQQKPIAETISTVQKKDLAQEQPLQKKGKEKEEDKKVQKKSDKEEDKKVQKKGEKEEDKKVQKKSDKEEDKKVQKKGEKEEDKKVQKKSDKEEDKKVQKKGEKEEDKKVQKKCAECENEDKKAQKKEEKTVQAKLKESNSVNEKVESNLSSSKGGGNAMDKNTKREMESGFGADFSGVNIHTDSRAVQMSEELGAQAFTHGSDVYFNKGKYNPDSKEGKHLLAHELTHTIQQTGSKQKSGAIQKSSIENHQEDLHAERPENPQFKGNPPLEKANDNQMLISTGQKGQYVAELQNGLMQAGQSLPKFGADGDFGSETRNAVIGFQAENGLNKVDGIVGPETIGALDNKLVGQKGGDNNCCGEAFQLPQNNNDFNINDSVMSSSTFCSKGDFKITSTANWVTPHNAKHYNILLTAIQGGTIHKTGRRYDVGKTETQSFAVKTKDCIFFKVEVKVINPGGSPNLKGSFNVTN